MSPESQRIAIAETCGYRKGESKPLWWACPSGQPFKACGIKDLPDYLNDLNAIHEAEKVLSAKDLWWKFCAHLNAIVCADNDEPLNQDSETLWCMMHATAAQRAEAFLRTLNLWDDSK